MKNHGLSGNLNAGAAKGGQHSSSGAEDERPGDSRGGRLRMVRKGVLNCSVQRFSEITGRAPATIKRYEANTPAPPDKFLEEVSAVSGVALAWLKNGGELLPSDDQVVRARIKRAAVRDAAESKAAMATGGGEVARYPSALERAFEQKPTSAAARGGRVSLELLTQVVGTIEQWLHENRSKVRIGPDKKAMLIALAYTHFEGREFAKQEMEQFFRLVA